jgi:hypothetical protein
VACLMFEQVQELQLSGFNHQNALMDLDIVRLQPPQNGALLKVTFRPAFGVGGSFNCFRAHVVAVSEGRPESSAYA